MVRMRNLVKVGNREVKKRYVGNKLIFEDLGDKTEVLSGTEIYTDKADDSVVHVEVDGKSYQQAGSGKNLMPLQGWDLKGDAYVDVDSGYIYSSYRNPAHSPCVKIKPNTHYTYSHHGHPHRALLQFLDINNDLITSETSWGGAGILSSPNNAYYFRRYAADTSNQLELEGFMFQLEEGSTATEYEPPAPTPDYPIKIHSLNDFDVVSSVGRKNLTDDIPAPEEITEDDSHPNIDKINLSLDEPLRSVGDIKDRLFRDSDGLWKVERNIGEIVLDGDRGYRVVVNKNSEYSSYYFSNNDIAIRAKMASSHYPFFEDSGSYATRKGQQIRNYRDPSASIMITDYTMTHTEFQNKLRDSPVALVYEKRNPEVETLDQELQDKLNNLRSFENSNYVYAVINDKTDTLSDYIADILKPTLHTTFKSKGWYDYYQKTLLK